MSLTTGLLRNSYKVVTRFVCVVISDSRPAGGGGDGGQCLLILGQLVRKGHLLIFLFFPPHMVDVCMTAIDSRDPGSPGGVRGRIWDILQTQSAGGTASQQGGPPVRDSGRGLS